MAKANRPARGSTGNKGPGGRIEKFSFDDEYKLAMRWGGVKDNTANPVQMQELMDDYRAVLFAGLLEESLWPPAAYMKKELNLDIIHLKRTRQAHLASEKVVTKIPAKQGGDQSKLPVKAGSDKTATKKALATRMGEAVRDRIGLGAAKASADAESAEGAATASAVAPSPAAKLSVESQEENEDIEAKKLKLLEQIAANTGGGRGGSKDKEEDDKKKGLKGIFGIIAGAFLGFGTLLKFMSGGGPFKMLLSAFTGMWKIIPLITKGLWGIITFVTKFFAPILMGALNKMFPGLMAWGAKAAASISGALDKIKGIGGSPIPGGSGGVDLPDKTKPGSSSPSVPDLPDKPGTPSSPKTIPKPTPKAGVRGMLGRGLDVVKNASSGLRGIATKVAPRVAGAIAGVAGGAMLAAGASLVGAVYAGYEIGTAINNATGASDKISDWLVSSKDKLDGISPDARKIIDGIIAKMKKEKKITKNEAAQLSTWGLTIPPDVEVVAPPKVVASKTTPTPVEAKATTAPTTPTPVEAKATTAPTTPTTTTAPTPVEAKATTAPTTPTTTTAPTPVEAKATTAASTKKLTAEEEMDAKPEPSKVVKKDDPGLKIKDEYSDNYAKYYAIITNESHDGQTRIYAGQQLEGIRKLRAQKSAPAVTTPAATPAANSPAASTPAASGETKTIGGKEYKEVAVSTPVELDKTRYGAVTGNNVYDKQKKAWVEKSEAERVSKELKVAPVQGVQSRGVPASTSAVEPASSSTAAKVDQIQSTQAENKSEAAKGAAPNVVTNNTTTVAPGGNKGGGDVMPPANAQLPPHMTQKLSGSSGV